MQPKRDHAEPQTNSLPWRPHTVLVLLFLLSAQALAQETFIKHALLGRVDDLVRRLKRSATDVDYRRHSDGASALMGAAVNGHTEAVQVLLDHGASVDLRIPAYAESTTGATALVLASDRGRAEVVRMLLDNGADYDIPTMFGITPLLSAKRKNHAEVVAILEEAGATVDERIEFLYVAWIGDSGELETRLRADETLVNARGTGGETALILAVEAGHAELAHILVDRGANVNLSDNSGRTALILASDHGHQELVRMLLDEGADIHVTDETGRTPALAASWGEHEDVLAMLEAAGAGFEGSIYQTISELRGTSPVTRGRRAGSLAELGSDAKPAIPVLMTLLNDHAPLQLQSPLFSGRQLNIGPLRYRPILTSVGERAALALSQIGSTSIVPDLIDLLLGDPTRCKYAASALGVIGDPAAIEPMLNIVLERGDCRDFNRSDTYVTLVKALARLDAIPALRAIANSPSVQSRARSDARYSLEEAEGGK